MKNKRNIAILMGDPSGIGPELICKILNYNFLKKINIIMEKLRNLRIQNYMEEG